MSYLKTKYSKAPVRKKLLIITTLISLSTLLLTSGIFIAYDINSAKSNARRELNILADILSKRIAPALDFFGDTEQINKNLSDLSSKEDVILACVYDKNQNLITNYQNNSSLECDEISESTNSSIFGLLFVYKDITSISGQVNGAISIVSDLGNIKARLLLTIIGVFVVFVIIFIINYIISSKIILFITKPVAELTNTAHMIADDNNYNLIAQKIHDDEIGELTTIFNKMVLKIKNYNKNLERLVDQRTKELSDSLEVTESALEKAKEADRHKSEWIRNMSHEFRTPVHGILSFARFGLDDISQEEIDRSEIKLFFNRIVTSGQRLQYLVDGILDIAATESGKIVLNKSETDIVILVKNVVQELSGILKDNSLIIDIEEPEFDRIVVIDDKKIIQVITNLVGNSIKFSPKGSSITIFFQKSESEMTVNISDEGCGVPHDELEDIFSPFKQSSATNDQSGGTGLGLSISKNLVEAHGGRIWVTNNSGKGATFSFTINLT